MATTTTSRMPLKLLEGTPEFRRLSIKAKLFVSSYVASYESFGVADATFATVTAYRNRHDETARKMSYNVLKAKKVAAALQVWRDFGKSKYDLYVEQLEREMKAAPEGSKKRGRLVELYGQYAFGTNISKQRKSKKSKRSTSNGNSKS